MRFPDVTLAYNVESYERVDQVLQEAIEAGETLVKPSQCADWGGDSRYFADPDGHLWEVTCPQGS